MRTFRPALTSAAIVIAVLAIGCGQGRAPAAAQPIAGDGPHRGGELAAAIRTDPPGFNPYVGRNTNVTELLSRLLHAPLVRVNRARGEIEPWLAESWTESADGLTWTLKLRADARFSDGVPVTADDVLFAFQAIGDERNASGIRDSLLIGGKPLEVAARDRSTITIRFPAPFGPGLGVLDNLPILPAHKLHASLAAGRLRDAWTSTTAVSEVVGAGPFRVVSYAPAERVVLERNPYYWRHAPANGARIPDESLPYVDRITLLIVHDQNTEMLRLESGQLDIGAREIRPEDYLAASEQAARGRLALVDAGVSVDPNMMWFNLAPGAYSRDPRKRWLQSEDFRKAVSHAIDRRAIVDQVYLGAGVPVFGPVTPGNSQWYASDVPRFDYDPARARAIFTGILGFGDRDGDGMLEDRTGSPVRFSILTQQQDTIRMRTATVIQEQLRKSGIAVDVVGVDPGSLIERFDTGTYDAIYFGIEATSLDPANNLDFWLSSGSFHVWNPNQKSPGTDWERQIDLLMQRQVAATDPVERKRLFEGVQKILAEHVPVLCFAAPRMLVPVSSRVAGLQPAPLRPNVLWSADTLFVSNH